MFWPSTFFQQIQSILWDSNQDVLILLHLNYFFFVVFVRLMMHPFLFPFDQSLAMIYLQIPVVDTTNNRLQTFYVLLHVVQQLIVIQTFHVFTKWNNGNSGKVTEISVILMTLHGKLRKEVKNRTKKYNYRFSHLKVVIRLADVA